MSFMDTVSFVRKRLLKLGPAEFKAIELATGVKRYTLKRIADGSTPNPGYNTLEPVRKYLESA